MRERKIPILIAGLILLALPAGAQGGRDEPSPLVDMLLADGMTRERMVDLYQALAPAQFEPPACVADQEMFSDVPATNPFCAWIEELARRGVTSGCTAGKYCPGSPVTRAQMAVFVLKAVEGARELAGWGQIRADGTIRLASPSLVSVDHIATGVYCLTFDPPPSQAGRESAVASVHASSAHGFAGTGGGVGDNGGCSLGLSILTTNTDGEPADKRFTFQVPR